MSAFESQQSEHSFDVHPGCESQLPPPSAELSSMITSWRDSPFSSRSTPEVQWLPKLATQNKRPRVRQESSNGPLQAIDSNCTLDMEQNGDLYTGKENVADPRGYAQGDIPASKRRKTLGDTDSTVILSLPHHTILKQEASAQTEDDRAYVENFEESSLSTPFKPVGPRKIGGLEHASAELLHQNRQLILKMDAQEKDAAELRDALRAKTTEHRTSISEIAYLNRKVKKIRDYAIELTTSAYGSFPLLVHKYDSSNACSDDTTRYLPPLISDEAWKMQVIPIMTFEWMLISTTIPNMRPL